MSLVTEDDGRVKSNLADANCDEGNHVRTSGFCPE